MKTIIIADFRSAKWSFDSFRGEFGSVELIERRDFFNLHFNFSLLDPCKNEKKVSYWTVYNSFHFILYYYIVEISNEVV